MRQVTRIWAGAPNLRSLYRAQIRRMKRAMAGLTASVPGFNPNNIATYYPRSLEESYYDYPQDKHAAWAVGYHAGRAFRLRELAYDMRPTWAISGYLNYLQTHYHYSPKVRA